MPKRGKTGWKDKNGDYLVIDEVDRYGHEFKISWYLVEDSDMGGSLGEFCDQQPSQELCRLAAENGGVQKGKNVPFTWDSCKAVTEALRAINAGMLAYEAGKPLPEWAMKATAAGWKPPKGWVP